MFRRLNSSLPRDPEFPADLEKLGYFINSTDQIRSIAHPTQEFNFFISKNERVCEVQREAFNTCIRANLLPRFQAAGLQITRLGPGSSSSSSTAAETIEPHIPILTTPNLTTASRIVLYIGEHNQDLGIFAHRTLSQRCLAAGSILDFVASVQAHATSDSAAVRSDTAIVIANPGQLVWYRRGARAMTLVSWNALPRKTGVDCMMRLDGVKNRVEGHGTVLEHVRSVMGFLEGRMREGAQVEIIGLGQGGEEVVTFLDRNWGQWRDRVAAVCIGLGYVWRVLEEVVDEDFKSFWGKLSRAYLIHNTPLDTPLYGREDIGCNCYSSGESVNTECIMPSAYGSILDFFQLVRNLPGYEERPLAIEAEGDDDVHRVASWETTIADQEMVERLQRSMIGVSKVDGGDVLGVEEGI